MVGGKLDESPEDASHFPGFFFWSEEEEEEEEPDSLLRVDYMRYGPYKMSPNPVHYVFHNKGFIGAFILFLSNKY